MSTINQGFSSASCPTRIFKSLNKDEFSLFLKLLDLSIDVTNKNKAKEQLLLAFNAQRNAAFNM